MTLREAPSLEESLCQCLIEAIWAHDPATAMHCQRVGRLTRAFLKELGFAPEQIKHGHLGGMIHDVGKIGVPVEILHKSSPLTEAEKNRMNGHALWGKQIVKALLIYPEMKPILEVVLYHHERFDGAGYPFHQEGETIPFMARVVTLTDAFDAMTEKRSYGTVKTIDEALDEIAKHAGTQFDPILANHFLEWMRDLSEKIAA